MENQQSRDKIAQAYFGIWGNSEVQRKSKKRIHWLASQVEGKVVLDVGCSEGILALLLAREGIEVVGIDYNAEALTYAQELLDKEIESVKSRVTLIHSDFQAADLKNSLYDTVIIGEILEHLLHPKRLIEKTNTWLKPGGRLLVTTPYGYFPDPDHKQTFTLIDFINIIKHFFTPEHLSVEDGYIRFVGRKEKNGNISWSGFDESLLLAISEKAAIEQQITLRSHIESWKAVEKNLRQNCEELKRESQARKKDLEKLERSCEQKDKEIKELQEKYEQKNKEIKELQEKYEQKNKELKTVKEEFRKESEEVNILINLKSILDELQLATTKITSSRRWKLAQVISIFILRSNKKSGREHLKQIENIFSNVQMWNFTLGKENDDVKQLISWIEQYRFHFEAFISSPELKVVNRLISAREKILKRKKGAPPGRHVKKVLKKYENDKKTFSDYTDDKPFSSSGLLNNQNKLISTKQMQNISSNPLPKISETPPVRGENIHFAAILDEFSWMCWQYECNLIAVTPDLWKEQLAVQRPDLLFVESAWRGNGGSWQYLISNSKQTPSDSLVELVKWCKKQGIPTVFWNKEDPTDFKHFLNTAKLFDFVFTTDENCVKQYNKALGHDRVFPLSFGAQPMIHNPVPDPKGRTKQVAFAGAWYKDRHDQRNLGADIVLRPAFKYGLHIYDRNWNKPELAEKHSWPEDFHPYIIGGLNYSDMLNEYRRYKVFLNVNSVVDSPTMFSRRVYELLACGTPVISSYARGIEEMLGKDVVHMSRSSEETEEYLDRLLNDKNYHLKISERGIRKVMSKHTYGHRFQEIIECIGKYGSAGTPLSYSPAKVQATEGAKIPPHTPAVLLPPSPEVNFPEGPTNRPNLVVGTIVDELFESYWRYEFNMVKFSRDDWKNRLSKAKPSLLFIDSAWHGNNGTWSHHISHQKKGGPSPDFVNLVKWCRKRNIPVVFWNREDPPNFDSFIKTAEICDYIFTTDADCIPDYIKRVGHDRIYSLPFAAQPRIHNPIGDHGERPYDLTFAGTWYAKKHSDRIKQMNIILQPALKHNVHIYDRMLYYTRSNYYVYPIEFRKNIAGSLTYDEMIGMMKKYRVMLNVNSVIGSPTMCSCRVLEALMCGAAVVSGYARGIENLLGADLVPMPQTPEDTEHAITRFLEDEEYRLRTVHLAQRKILQEHTCSIRMDEILCVLGMEEHILNHNGEKVSIVVSTNRPGNLKTILENYKRQTYEPIELIVVLHGIGEYADEMLRRAEDMDLKDVTVLAMDKALTLGDCLNAGLNASSGMFISKMDDDNFYGPEFTSDLMCVFQYVDADIVGKLSYYVYVEGLNIMGIRFSGSEHKYDKFVSGSAMIVKREVFDKFRFPSLTVGEDTEFFKLCSKQGVKIYSADPYNYVCMRNADLSKHTWKIEDEKYMQKVKPVCHGLDLERVVF